jgi:hydrogenase maturation protease
MMAGQASMVIIGVGNEYRGDDGAGIAVARRLRVLFSTGVTVLEESGEGAALIEAWQGATWVILVDAVRSGSPPGTIHRLDARVAPMPTGFFAEAVELARSLDQLPPHVIVYGIEGENFTAGVELSPSVKQAVGEVVERAAEEVRAAY